MHEWFMSMFKVLRMLFWTVSFYMLVQEALYIVYIVKYRKQDKTLESYVGKFFSKKQGIILCQVLIILGFLSSPSIFSKFQNTNIGSLLEKESYCEQYYVYLRNDNNKAKSYRLRAEIIKDDYGYSSWDDNGDDIFVVQGNGYFLKKVYWNNGGYLTFIDDDNIEVTSSTRIYPGKEASVTDYHDNDYYVTLTTEKVLSTVSDEEKHSNNMNNNW